MALKTSSEKSEAPATPTTVLELALYRIYTWKGETFEKGKPYRFQNADAMVLLSEQDLGRPVWKIYQPPARKSVVRTQIMDATGVHAEQPSEEVVFGNNIGKEPPKRIDVGSDEEIADVLSKVEDDGNVTV